MLSYETGDAGVTITDCEESAEGEVVIPDEIAGLPVISIGFEAFRGCSSLTSITIPEGVTSIGDSAFEHCRSLTSITIPKGVTSIGDGAFNGCSEQTSITSIGGKAFMDCTGLNSITIPKAFHSDDEASRLGLDKLWPDGFALPDSSSK